MDDRFNPFSLILEQTATPFQDWPETWQHTYEYWARPLESRLYPEDV